MTKYQKADADSDFISFFQSFQSSLSPSNISYECCSSRHVQFSPATPQPPFSSRTTALPLYLRTPLRSPSPACHLSRPSSHLAPSPTTHRHLLIAAPLPVRTTSSSSFPLRSLPSHPTQRPPSLWPFRYRPQSSKA